MEKDVVLQSSNILIQQNNNQIKPAYIIKLAGVGKEKSKLFIAVEPPKFEISFIQTKGFFYTGDENVVYSGYIELLNNTEKSLYVEMWFPWHTIFYIRSLFFKGDKKGK